MHDLWQENHTMLMRWVARLRRNPLGLATTLLQPVLWLVLFGNLLSQMASGTVPGGDYLDFMTAAAVVMTVFNGAILGGMEILFDRETGFLERLLAAPINRLSIVTSRFMYVITLTSTQGLLIVATSYVLGVRFAAGLGGIGVILFVGALFGSGITTLSIILAFSLRGHGQFFELVGFLGLPVLFLSTALVPLDAMPMWMRIAAQWNPMTHAIEATRVLILSGWDVSAVLRMVALLSVFDVLMLLIAARVLRRGLA